ncbi:Protein FLX-like 2 [Zea mays]|uniref:Protein FLX-like 2 n=1 Tax=Zea mays TaxID=4577 RepID=A0A3L6FSN3_MAIZE|nr:Protein FLX-like 2 [Zea mays]
MAHRGHLDGLTGQAPALMRHGSFAAGSLSSRSPLQSSSTLEMLENKLAMQTTEVEKLITENQRLASSHVVLRQDIVDTEKEMQMIRTHLGEVQTETDLQIRDLLERIRLMEVDIHSGNVVNKELHQMHMEAKRLITERQMLTLEIEDVTKELQKLSASGDNKSLPELLSELDRLRKEHHNLRSQFEFEKNTNVKQVEQMRTMEMNLITMTKQAEKLRVDVANAERRAQGFPLNPDFPIFNSICSVILSFVGLTVLVGAECCEAAAAQAAAHAAGAQVTASQPGTAQATTVSAAAATDSYAGAYTSYPPAYQQGAQAGAYQQGAQAGVYQQGAQAGAYQQGAQAGAYQQGGQDGAYQQGAQAGAYQQGAQAGAYQQGAQAGAYQQGAQAGAYQQGAQAGAYQQGAQAGAYQQGAQAGAYQQGAQAGAYQQGAQAGAYQQGAQDGAYQQGAQAGAYQQGAQAGAYNYAYDAGTAYAYAGYSGYPVAGYAQSAVPNYSYAAPPQPTSSGAATNAAGGQYGAVGSAGYPTGQTNMVKSGM